MNTPTRGDLVRSKIKGTGREINVYLHKDGSFVDYYDCNKKYDKNHLQFIEIVKT